MNFLELTKKYQEKINKELENFLDYQIKSIDNSEPFIKYCYELIKEYILNEGKRLRPIALILSYNAVGGKDEKKILLPAIALELFHNYFLILDDIMDEDDFRRNNPTVYKKLKQSFLENFSEETYNGTLFNKKSSRFAVSFAVMLGNLTSILSKKAILLSGFSKEVKYDAITVLEEIDKLIYHGQMQDILMEYKDKTSMEQYLDMVKLKTGVLLGMSFELGALFANADENTRHLLKEFGINLGMSYQIQDDILDLTTQKGHEQGSDIKKGKKTLLMIKTLEKATDEQKKILNNITENSSESEIKKVIEIMHDIGAVDFCSMLAKEKNNHAKDIVKKMDIAEHYKLLFTEFGNYILNRTV